MSLTSLPCHTVYSRCAQQFGEDPMDLLEVSDKQDEEVPAVFSHPANNYNLSDPTPLVIPTGAPQERSGSGVFAEQPLVTPSIQVANLPESDRPPLVIPTEAKRSGGICSVPCGSLKSFLGSDAVKLFPPKQAPSQLPFACLVTAVVSQRIVRNNPAV
jgi:hypothetical protein